MSEKFFLRFRWSDRDALAREIEAAEKALAAARGTGAGEIEAACRLANALTPADREAEAVELLHPVLRLARHSKDPAPIAWVLHYLATAEQYCGHREVALRHFTEALDITARADLPEVEHFIWHHCGRCYAEQGDIAPARLCFERALAIREKLGLPLAEKTRQAIIALDGL